MVILCSLAQFEMNLLKIGCEIMQTMAKNRINVTIVTGFLGSGKTTFLKNYVTTLMSKGETPAIIVNEFGAFDVDGTILEGDVSVTSILNGCVCCDLKSELVSKLKHYIDQTAANHIVIEATGIAHPIELIVACQDPEIIRYIKHLTCIGIADAKRFLTRGVMTASTRDLMEEQLAVCHNIVINKMDLLSVSEATQIKVEMRDLAPQAQHVFTSYGRIENGSVIHGNAETLHVQDAQGHHKGIKTMQYTFQSPVSRSLFYQFMMTLPENVLRLKGYVRFRDEPDVTYLFQYAYGMPDYMPVVTDAPTTIVIIGMQLDHGRIRNKLDVIQFT